MVTFNNQKQDDIVIIQRDDVLKSIYFILSMVQSQKGKAMHGVLSSRGDLIGGIFDRWINTIPESVIFNKILFPSIVQNNKVEIISDFYHYDPREAGIAPDVIGIKVNNKIIPFTRFDNRWIPEQNKPQIEIKTFKKNQKMVSLRNQGYNNEYLVMVETDFRIDYLLPFFSEAVLSDEVYNSLEMDDSVFVINNDNNLLDHFPKLRIGDDSLGTVKLLKIANAQTFMNNSTHCEERISVQYIDNVEEVEKRTSTFVKRENLKNYCEARSYNIYSYNQNWYKQRNDIKTLDFYTDNIDVITITKKNKSNMYIEVSEDCFFNDFKLLANRRYKVDYATLDRKSSQNDEYFLQKSLIQNIPDSKVNLISELKKIIDENK